MSTTLPSRPFLGITLLLVALWGGAWLISLLPPPGSMHWWTAPYIVTVVCSCVFTAYRGLCFISPDTK